MLFLQGVDVRDAMQYMGHATFQVTMDIYTDTEQYCRFDIEPDLADRLKTDFKIPKPSF
jgi:integrase